MIIQGSRGIGNLAVHIRDVLLPTASDPFVISDLRLTAQLIDATAEEFDRTVDNLMRDRAELVDFFTKVRAVAPDPLTAMLDAALADAVDGYRVGDLMDRADRDLATFIAAQDHIALALEQGAPWAPGLDRAAWRFLENHTERNRYKAVGR